MKLLVIEDEKEFAGEIRSFFERENYICELAFTFAEADEKINLYHYDCIIVDITLPDGNGMEIIRHLKEIQPETGIIIISARNTLGDKISGLGIGADDYMTKPFHISELNARLKSILRRRYMQGNREITFGDIRILPDMYQVYIKRTPLELTKKEFDLLLYFIHNKNRVLTKEAIAEHLLGDHADMLDSFDFIYTHIKNLRNKILTNGGHDYIKTIYGIGYKLTAL